MVEPIGAQGDRDDNDEVDERLERRRGVALGARGEWWRMSSGFRVLNSLPVAFAPA